MEKRVRYATQSFEEHNASTLGFISVQQRITSEKFQQGWADSYLVDGKPGMITCKADLSLGVPHAFDNDVSTAIHTLYVANGETPDGKVATTMAELCRLIGVPTSGVYYAMIRQSIERLGRTHYVMERTWFDASTSRYTKAGFNYLLSYSFEDTEHPFQPEQNMYQVSLVLNEYMRRNLQHGHYLALNPLSMEPLHSATARAQYRMIEGLRRDPKDITRASESLVISASELISAGRILIDTNGEKLKASRVTRLFDPYMTAMKLAGHLRNVCINKRGDETYYELTFSRAGNVYDTAAFKALCDAGVWESTARDLAARFPREAIDAQISHTMEQFYKGDIKNPGALIASELRKNEGRDALTQSRLKKKLQTQKAGPAKREPAQPIAQRNAAHGETKISQDDPFSANLGMARGISQKQQWSAEQLAQIEAGIRAQKITATDLIPFISAKHTKPSIDILLRLAASEA